jgi:hypothetical protein
VSEGTAVVTGSDAIRRGTRMTPAGAWLLDVRRWALRRIDRTASAASSDDGVVLTFGGPRAGVSRFGSDGRRRWRALRGVRVRDAVAAGPRVYALDDPPRATRVVDAETGRVLSRTRSLMRIDVVHPPDRWSERLSDAR